MSIELAQSVVERLPSPDYGKNYQPNYQDIGALTDAIHAVQQGNKPTTPLDIDTLSEDLADMTRPIGIVGNCAEPVGNRSVEVLAETVVRSLSIVERSRLLNPIVIYRGLGQSTKPRSNPIEILDNGLKVEPYMGDMVNNRDPSQRSPDPWRMVSAAIQASGIQSALGRRLGMHVAVAHEALLLGYEEASIETNRLTGKQYLLSADLPWIGVRTNDPEGDHVALLSRVQNPKGIKLGPDTTAEKVARLSEKLNPEGRPGGLLHMLRMGPNNMDGMLRVIEAIKAHSPGGRIMYDIHGTRERVVTDIIGEISLLADACKSLDVQLDGVHLETIADDSRLECPDTHQHKATHPGNIDRQLNPRQTLLVLNATAPFVNR